MIMITPMIPIDDAFIGICMRRAGLTNHIYQDKRFLSWGFKPFNERRFDVCRINEIIYYHKFTPREMDCFWPKFIKFKEKEDEFKFSYVIVTTGNHSTRQLRDLFCFGALNGNWRVVGYHAIFLLISFK